MLRRRAALPLARSWSPECMPAPCVWQEEEAEAERLASIVPLTADEVKEFDATTFSYRKKVANVKEANIADELLSEPLCGNKAYMAGQRGPSG